MSSPTVRVDVYGATGRSFADLARATGSYGADSDDTDAEVLDKLSGDISASTLATSRLYPSTAAGIAATTNGQYFSVPETGTTFLILYRNNAGSAVEVNRYPSKTSFSAAGGAALIGRTGGGTVQDFIDDPAVPADAIFYKGGERFLYERGALTDQNLFLGYQAGNFTMTGAAQLNHAFGYQTLKSITTATLNSMFGARAGWSITTGSVNSGFGAEALLDVTTGEYNDAFGCKALWLLTTGSRNKAFGQSALRNLTTGDDNCAFGQSASLALIAGSNNSAFGNNAMTNGTTGSDNNAFGLNALFFNTGSQNCAFGRETLYQNLGGGSNSAFGHQALHDNSTGSSNSAFGQYALYGNVAASNNTAFGFRAGYGPGANENSTVDTNCTFVGYAASRSGTVPTATPLTNMTVIGNGAQGTASNTVTLGNGSIVTLRCQVTTITALSDERYKKDIAPLDIPDEALDEIEIVTFLWAVEGMSQDVQVGVIAQQLDAWQNKWGLEWLGLVDKTNPDRWEATPGKLLFPLILRTQRLAARISALEAA